MAIINFQKTLTFSRKSKLIKTDDFSSVFNFRKRLSGHFLVIHYQYNQCGHPRLGLVVAKKVARSSVDRNYMRRVLRELFRQNQQLYPAVDLVVRPQRIFKRSDYLMIKLEFNKLMAKLSLLPVITSANNKADSPSTSQSST